MANFTIELKDVIETIFGTTMDDFYWCQPYNDVVFNGISYRHLPTVPDWDKLGLGYYPIFDELYRPVLNGKIVSNFFTREIGVETIDLWIQRTASKMQNIMPYFNKLYESEKIPYQALATMRLETDRNDTVHSTGNDVSNTTADSSSNTSGRSVNSTTPNTMLSGDEDYATGASDSNSQSSTHSTGETESNSTNDATNEGNSVTSGYQGAESDLIMKYRDSFLNIDMNVMSQMEELFMGILDTSDNFTSQGNFYSW
jgi:hypothetical protein